MTDLFTYFLKVNIALTLFYLIYHLWLRNLTFYRVNRYFLILSLLFSMLYPLINWNWFGATSALPAQVVNVIPVWEYQYTANQQVTISDYLSRLFYLTLIVFGLRLGISLFGILRIHLSSSTSIWKAYRYRKSDEDILPFSFWKNVYLNPSKHREDELEGIFRHEYIHVRQLHSLDILLAEIVLIMCWYNPFAWLFRRVIRENIEFVTDNNVLASGINKQEYQYSLLTVLHSSKQPSIANHFNMKNVKKRISMMNKKQTSSFHKIKYMFVVPLAIGSLSVFTISEAKQRSFVPHQVINSIRSLNLLKADTVVFDTVKVEKDTLEEKEPSIKIIGTKKVGTIEKGSPASTETRTRFNDPDKKPLYVIDGEMIDSEDLSVIDPKDIKAVRVLKNSSATSLYGKRAKHGVIEITMKKNNSVSVNQSDTTTDREIVAVSIDSVKTSIHSDKTDSQGVAIYLDGKKTSREKTKQLNPEEIASMHVYKGKDAVERYGADAKRGIIVITSKSAIKNKSKE